MTPLYNTISNSIIFFIFVSLFLISSDVVGIVGSFIVVALLFILLVMTFLHRNHKFVIPKYQVLIACFIIFAALSYFWAFDKSLVIDKIVTLGKNLLMVSVVYYHCKNTKKNTDSLFEMIMYGGGVISLFALIYYGPTVFISSLESEVRMDNDFLNANTLGMLIAQSFLINIFFVVFKRKNRGFLLVSIPMLFVLAFAGSRKSILMLLFGLIFMLLLKYNKRKINIITFVKLAFFCVLSTIGIYSILKMFSMDYLTIRLENLMSLLSSGELNDYSLASRAYLAFIGVDIFLNSPIIGIGIDNARVIVLSIMNIDWYLHSNYLELLADVGMVGTLLYYSVYVFLLYKIYNARMIYCDSSNYVICSVMVLLNVIMDLFFVSYYKRVTFFYITIYAIELEYIYSQKSEFERK